MPRGVYERKRRRPAIIRQPANTVGVWSEHVGVRSAFVKHRIPLADLARVARSLDEVGAAVVEYAGVKYTFVR